jgi:hypothetical protein
LTVSTDQVARHAWPVQVPTWVWDAISQPARRLRGPGFTHEPLPAEDGLLTELWPADVTRALEGLPELLRTGAVTSVIVRGPEGSGRKSLARRLAARLGRGVLSFSEAHGETPWRLIAPLATLLDALPVVERELGPGESLAIPGLGNHGGPLVLVLGGRGGVSGVVRPVTLSLDVPSRKQRKTFWHYLVPGGSDDLTEALATRYRMPLGALRTLAEHARANAALRGCAAPELPDFAVRARALHTAAMGSLATPLPEGGTWDDLALSSDALSELRAVESRCRHRERLSAEDHRFAPNAGVRVLLTGPSGTGKTLAARVLASALGRDVYRVELAAVVNKYIGETEKNLERVLSLAEALDVVLLFDEGDALLARRTAVQSSTDRYANLETNFLLQRLESFEGIVFITTNAADRVDSAFQRRMDAVIELRAPDSGERRRLWELHLPSENEVDPSLLERLAVQCPLTGGQIRNAAVHARLLALDDGGSVNDERVTVSVQREYRKLGTTCPLWVG